MPFLRKQTLSTRILFAFGAAVVLFMLNTLYANRVLSELDQSAADQNRIVQAAETAYSADINILRIILLLEDYMYRPDRPRIREELRRVRAEAAADRQRLRRLTRLPAVVALLNQYEALLPARMRGAQRIIEAVDQGRPAEEVRQARNDLARLDAVARAQLRDIVSLEDQALQQSYVRDEQIRRGARRRLNMVSLLNLILVVTIALLVSQDLKKRLTSMRRMVRQIAGGDYSARVAVTGTDEVDALGDSFNAMALQLGQVERVKDEFVALASHQLRTPATAVKGNLGMLLEGFAGEITEDQRGILNDAWESNERQLAVIESMLTISRLDAGQMVLSRSMTDLAALVRSVADEQQPILKSRQQKLNFSIPAGGAQAMVDPERIRMVFENLLSNASKYTPSDGKIEVQLADADGEVVLAVEDNGVGIPEQVRYKLFKKFSRIDNPLSTTVGGTGLGLYLVRLIVELHGGRIDVDSTPGEGSRFEVHLPKE